jgi:phosphotransferase system  glucose/maltose/N-acetylglucosamine-specific IIC component
VLVVGAVIAAVLAIIAAVLAMIGASRAKRKEKKRPWCRG